jgi:O-antigen/teichoic acid export membrane protein
VFGYSLPLMSSDLLVQIPTSLSIILLEHFHATAAVAELRAVQPVARLNHVVLQSFALLYIPLAARMFARNDREGLNDLYWRTAIWISVLTFPVFVVTFCLAGPVTTLLFGSTYAASASLLAVLAAGWYFNAALGFNAHTLRVHGRVRVIVAIDLTAAALGLAATLPLIARFGAMGAAIGSTLTLVLHNLLNHAGLLALKTGVHLLDRRFLKTYLTIVAVSGAVLVVQRVVAPPLPVGLAIAGLASALLVRLCRDTLRADQTFPRLLRIPLLRHLLAGH